MSVHELNNGGFIMTISKAKKLITLLLVVSVISSSLVFLTSCLKVTPSTTDTTSDTSDTTNHTTSDIVSSNTKESETTSETTDVTSTTNVTSTTPETTSETLPPYTDPPRSANASFNGESIRFIIENTPGNRLNDRSIVADEFSQDIVDRRIEQRNRMVEEQLNVKIELAHSTQTPGHISYVLPSLVSGADLYDVIGANRHVSISLAIQNNDNGSLLLNYSTIPEDENYITRNAPYWAMNVNDSMTYKRASYWLTGDLSLSFSGGLYVSFVNKAIWEENKEEILDLTGYDDIYELVKAGKWTIDALHETTKIVYADQNNNNKADIGDRFGLITTTNYPIDALIYGFDIKYTNWNNGKPELQFKTTYKDLIEANLKLYKFLTDNKGVYVHTPSSSNDVINMFSNGKSLAVIDTLSMAESLKYMSDGYYVVPTPKLNESQSNYSSGLQESTTIFAIPKTNTKVAATTATLDYMAYKSYEMVTPMYYDLLLKEDYTRDENAAEMINIIRESVYSDFIVSWSYSIDNCTTFMRNNVGAAVTTLLRSMEEKWKNYIEMLLTQIEKNVQMEKKLTKLH